MTIVIICMILCVFVGIGIGDRIYNKRWADNADDYRRVEFRGRLYKVVHWEQMDKLEKASWELQRIKDHPALRESELAAREK